MPVALQVLLPLASSDGDDIADRTVKGGLLVPRRGGRDGQRLEAGRRSALTSANVRLRRDERLHHSERRVPDALVPFTHVRRVQPVNGRHLSRRRG